MKVRMINRKPDRHLSIFLTLLPFALVLLAYVVGSEIRLAANPNDKLLPGLHSFADAIARVAFEPDKRLAGTICSGSIPWPAWRGLVAACWSPPCSA